MATVFHRKAEFASQSIEPRDLVCSKCWHEVFSTAAFQQLCKAPFMEDGKGDVVEASCSYTRSISDVEISTSEGCGWCTFIANSQKWNDLTFRKQMTCSVGFNLTGHTDESCLPPEGEGFLQCQCTPPGNNEISLNLVLGESREAMRFDCFKHELTDPMVAVTAGDVQRQLTKAWVWQQAKQWLRDCAQHGCCPEQTPKPLPSRVIDVESDPTGRTVRLVHGRGKSAFYVALSYCWGGQQSGMTNSQNLQQRWTSIDRTSLSLSVQEAIWVTRRLGLRYIWIDAICLVQDSIEDKVHELASMAAIYQQAYVTIIASSGKSSSEGFLADRAQPAEPTYLLPFWTKDMRLTSVSIRASDTEGAPRDVLDSRAWAFQESLLSSRRLLFTEKALQYECRHHRVNLGGSIYTPATGLEPPIFVGVNTISILPNHGFIQVPRILNVARQTRHENMESARENALWVWQRIIGSYAERSLTIKSDIFSALAAIAEAFHPYVGRAYLAGLWEGPMLPSLLLWQGAAFDYNQLDANLVTEYLAPSWSWATAPQVALYLGIIDDGGELLEWQGELISAHVTPKYDSFPYGPVVSAYLRVRTRFRRAHFDRANFGKRPLRPWWQRLEGTNKMTWYPRGPKGRRKSKWLAPSVASIDPRFRRQSGDVLCLALVRSSNTLLYKLIHGLSVQPTEEDGIYRRVGMFYNTEWSDFDDCETMDLVLV